MDFCKYIVSLKYRYIEIICQAESYLERYSDIGKWYKRIEFPRGVLDENWDGYGKNRTMPKVLANDRRSLSLLATMKF